jgi:acyl dehydratase
MTEIIYVPQLPPALPALLKAALSATRRPQGVPKLPDWQVRVRAVRVDRSRLSAYTELCGLPESDEMPILYPQVMGTPLYLELMTRPGFPIPLLGIVHVRNEVQQQRPLLADETLDFDVRLGPAREVKAGLEFDLIMECGPTDSEPVWRAVITVIHRMRTAGSGKSGHRAPPPAPVPAAVAEYLELDAPGDTGRRYAKVSQDYNPIHLTGPSARLFGFKRPIAHGLWTAARCLALLQGRLQQAPKAYSIQFKQPLFLPGRAALRVVEESGGVDFALLATGSDKVHLTGTLR